MNHIDARRLEDKIYFGGLVDFVDTFGEFPYLSIIPLPDDLLKENEKYDYKSFVLLLEIDVKEFKNKHQSLHYKIVKNYKNSFVLDETYSNPMAGLVQPNAIAFFEKVKNRTLWSDEDLFYEAEAYGSVIYINWPAKPDQDYVMVGGECGIKKCE